MDIAITDGSPTLEFEKLASGLYLEGLAIEDGTAWFSDVIAGGFWERAPDGSTRRFCPDRRWIGGLSIASDGSVISTGQGGILRSCPTTGKSDWLICETDGAALDGVNEIAPDGRGGFYFGTCDLSAIAEARRPGPVAIYHVCAQGNVRKVSADLGFTNGMALSPDGTRFYCNESFDGTYVHDVEADGRLSNRRVFLAKRDCDGMAIDREGNVWITGFASGHIERISPDGTRLSPFETPFEAITQCRFGGLGMNELYLVTVPLDAGPNLAAGKLASQSKSYLVRCRPGVTGYPMPRICVDNPRLKRAGGR